MINKINKIWTTKHLVNLVNPVFKKQISCLFLIDKSL